MMIGHYRIIEKVGEGGMGAVYRAEDTRLGRTVALKLLASDRIGDPKRRARFLQEARLASSLNHPNIATILDVGEAEGRDYIAMEFVAGESLRRKINGQSLELSALLDLAIQIADALAEAHSRDIVHRDIKGENILVTSQRRIKILDFGLAKRLLGSDQDATLADSMTETGVIMGTVNYMSPEQALGQAVDARSDLFSFGVVLYEMATGRLPFAGHSATSIIDKIIHQPPAPPSHLNHLLAVELEQIVLKVLEKNPDERYQSAREMLVDLRRLKRRLDTGSLGATRAAPAVAARFSWKRRAVIAAALFAAFAAGAVIQRFLFRQFPPAPMRFSAVTNFAGIESEPALSPDGRSVAFVSNRGGEFGIWVSLLRSGSLVRITGDSNVKARPRWSPDGQRIAYARLNEAGLWDIWVVPALGGAPRRILANAGDPAWSPDGLRIAYANHDTNTLWTAETGGGNPRAVTQPEAGTAHAQPSFSRDGRQLAFIRRRGGPYAELAVAGLSDGSIRRLTDDNAGAYSPAWSPDDRWIYFASTRGGAANIWKVDVRSRELRQVTAGQGDDAELDISADGKRLVLSSYRMNINLAEISLESSGAARPQVKWLTTDSARGELSPAYSRDGKRIAYFSNRTGAEKESIWVMDADGLNPVQVVEDNRVNVYPRWMPDGRSVVYASRPLGFVFDQEIRRVAIASSSPQKLLPKALGAPWGDVGPDGRVVFRAPDGSVQVFDPATGQSKTLDGVKGATFRWSRDGRYVSSIVLPRQENDPEAGLWLYDLQGAPRKLFGGWAVWQSWAGNDEVFVLEGKPDCNGVLWRIRLDGSPPVRLSASLPQHYGYWQHGAGLRQVAGALAVRFDVHADPRRVVFDAFELNEADIGLLENP
jgi:Tol biopolymer transport system component/predicted Ser/Thr protein kinase